MDNECDRDSPCGVLLGGNEVDDGRAIPVNQSDSRYYLGDFCSFVDIHPQDLVCENLRLHKPIMRKMRRCIGNCLIY